MEAQKTIGLLRQAYYQGHGRYVNQLARVTIKFCKSSIKCREMRKFIEERLVDLARENPSTVIYVKPRLFKNPVIVGEYINGQQHYLSLSRMSKDQIGAWINWFLSRSGEDLYKLDNRMTTFNASIQGHWTPFYFRDPNSLLTKFPNEELGKFRGEKPTATEQLLELQKEQQQNCG